MKRIEKRWDQITFRVANPRKNFSESLETMVFVKWQSISGKDIGSFCGVVVEVERSSDRRHLVDYHRQELEETETIN